MNPEKIRNLILSVLEELGPTDPIKINYVVYLADLESYHRTGKTITGARWYKREWGIELEGFFDTLARMLLNDEVELYRAST